MSLILEALKKSEAERRLGETPGLSTLPVWKPRARASRAWWFLIPAVAIAAAAYWSNRDLLDGASAPEADAVAASGVQKADQALLEDDGAASLPEKESTAALTQKPLPPKVSEPRPGSQVAAAPMPEPQPMPQSMDDLEAMKGISPENQRRIRSGELFVPSPSLLAERGPTTEEPIITAESALPPPLPEPGMDAAGMSPAPADTPAADASPAPQAQAASVPESVATVVPPANLPAAPSPAVSAQPERETASSHPGVLDFYDLTLSQRQGLPALKMSMHVYHRDVARRFVIIDGKRLNEDGVMGQQLWAREILPDGVIIEYNDIRFFLPRLGG
jgi:general secretion pathway protein B